MIVDFLDARRRQGGLPVAVDDDVNRIAEVTITRSGQWYDGTAPSVLHSNGHGLRVELATRRRD
jgi:hypothetical protein